MSETAFLSWIKLIHFPSSKLRPNPPLDSNPTTRHLINRYRQSARRKHVAFELTDTECLWLLGQDCAYCGRPPHRNSTYYKLSVLYTGIDRIDASSAYCLSAVVPACWDCNNAKGIGSVEDFIAWAQRVRAHIAI